MRIILGSQSAGRKKVLAKMGLDFEVMPADIDEKAIRSDDPKVLTLALAHAKAEALLPKIQGPALLITSDQVVVCNGAIREKPVSAEEASAFLKSYTHYPAETVTSVVVANTTSGVRVDGTDIAKVWFHRIPEDVVEAYIRTGDPFLHAGGFDQDHPLLELYIQMIEGEADSITGLPRTLTLALMKQVGG